MKYTSKINEITELKQEYVTGLIYYLSQDETQNDEKFEDLIDVISFPLNTALYLLHSLMDAVKNEEYRMAQQLKNELVEFIDIVDPVF